jgi:hypothetical protein
LIYTSRYSEHAVQSNQHTALQYVSKVLSVAMTHDQQNKRRTALTTFCPGRPDLSTAKFCSLSTTSIPSSTRPNTTAQHSTAQHGTGQVMINTGQHRSAQKVKFSTAHWQTHNCLVVLKD